MAVNSFADPLTCLERAEGGDPQDHRERQVSEMTTDYARFHLVEMELSGFRDELKDERNT